MEEKQARPTRKDDDPLFLSFFTLKSLSDEEYRYFHPNPAEFWYADETKYTRHRKYVDAKGGKSWRYREATTREKEAALRERELDVRMRELKLRERQVQIEEFRSEYEERGRLIHLKNIDWENYELTKLKIY